MPPSKSGDCACQGATFSTESDSSFSTKKILFRQKKTAIKRGFLTERCLFFNWQGERIADFFGYMETLTHRMLKLEQLLLWNFQGCLQGSMPIRQSTPVLRGMRLMQRWFGLEACRWRGTWSFTGRIGYGNRAEVPTRKWTDLPVLSIRPGVDNYADAHFANPFW
ncbi:hypothetical protein ACFQAT_01710 [Undibacterium arcticum]